MTLHDFDEIRPFSEEEMQTAFNGLINDRQFNRMLNKLMPWFPKIMRNAMLSLLYHGIKAPQLYWLRIMRPIVLYVIL